MVNEPVASGPWHLPWICSCDWKALGQKLAIPLSDGLFRRRILHCAKASGMPETGLWLHYGLPLQGRKSPSLDIFRHFRLGKALINLV